MIEIRATLYCTNCDTAFNEEHYDEDSVDEHYLLDELRQKADEAGWKTNIQGEYGKRDFCPRCVKLEGGE